MRTSATKFVALALTAGAVLAGLAAAPAQASKDNGLVNVVVVDVLTGNQVVVAPNVTLGAASNICGQSVNVLSQQLASGNKGTCKAYNTSATKGFVVWS